MEFDHLLHWVPDLDTAVARYRELGFPVQPGGQHRGLGTHNAAWSIGAAYVELIAVRDWERFSRVRLLSVPAIAAALDSGGGALPFAVRVPDVAATVAELRRAGLPVADPLTGSIELPDGSTGSWQMTGFTDGPAWRPFFITYGPPPARREARVTERVVPPAPWSLDRFVVETPDPEGDARWLARVLGSSAASSGEGEFAVALPGCAIVLARGTAERITRVVVEGPGVPVGEVAGLRYERKGDSDARRETS